MRYKKMILGLALLIISITYIIHPFIIKNENYINSFKDKIIRFHIKANSDKDEDQVLKLKVRDRILEEVGSQFESSTSIVETRKMIEDNLDNIKHTVSLILQKEGKNLPVDVSLGNKNFPTRKYGSVTFPSGEYEALQITIGEGKGKNWWCVMFPPLCFVDINHSNPQYTQRDLKKVLTEEEIDLLLSNKEPPIVLKSKIAEMLEKTKIKLAKKK